jgi:hypothetical protein
MRPIASKSTCPFSENCVDTAGNTPRHETVFLPPPIAALLFPLS